MDRRSWLWRRKSSEKTPGESESSGSISSPSERFSDEQAYSGHSKQSPDITSRAAPNEESPGKIKALTEKLSAALLNISAKEEIVKQHAKVAEEAVTGWEKAEREVAGLKLQLDAAVKKNSALEDRVGHLDGALKECVRQLRYAREEQERKLKEVIAKRTNEWELRKSELESQLTKLSSQLEAAKSEAAASIEPLRPKIDAAEKENKSLRLDLTALSQKLEVRTLERDFSTKTAESASKQNLESIKKVAKLEAECRRLRSCARKASALVDSASDRRSDYTERSQTLEAELNEREPSQSGLRASSSEIVIMNDFLEMERLAALPEEGKGTLSPEARVPSNMDDREENALKVEPESMINRIADLEDRIEKLEAEKGGLGMALSESQAHLEASIRQLKDTEDRSVELESHLNECQAQLKASEGQLKRVQDQLIDCQDQLRLSHAKLDAAENELIELQTHLTEREDQLNTSEGHLRDAEAKLKELQDQLIECKDQLTRSQGLVKDTEARLSECQGKLTASEGQTKDANNIFSDLQAQLALTSKLKQDAEGDLEASDAKRVGVELRVKALELETSSLQANINSLVDEADKEHALFTEAMAKCRRLENELSKRDLEPHFERPVSCKSEKKAVQEKGLALAAGKLADCQKTIESLGKQLKSLATLDDFLVDSYSPLEPSKESSVFKTSELGKLPCIDCQ